MLAAHPYLKLKVASSPKGKNSDVEPKVHVNQAHKIERYVLLARVSCEYNIYKVDDVESLHCHSSSRPKADCQLQIEMLHISSVKRGTNWFADSLAHRKEKIARCRVGQILFTEGMWYVGRANLAAPVACRSCTKLDLEQPRCRVFYYVQAPHNSQAQRFGEIQCTEDYWHSISPFCNVVGFEKLEALYNTIHCVVVWSSLMVTCHYSSCCDWWQIPVTQSKTRSEDVDVCRFSHKWRRDRRRIDGRIRAV